MTQTSILQKQATSMKFHIREQCISDFEWHKNTCCAVGLAIKQNTMLKKTFKLFKKIT